MYTPLSVPRAATIGPVDVPHTAGSEVSVPPSDVHGPGLPPAKRRYQIALSPRAEHVEARGVAHGRGVGVDEPLSDCGSVKPVPFLRQNHTASSFPGRTRTSRCCRSPSTGRR